MKDIATVCRRLFARFQVHKVLSIKQTANPGKNPVYTVNQFMVVWSLTGGTAKDVIHDMETYVLGSLLTDYGNCDTKICFQRSKPSESGWFR